MRQPGAALLVARLMHPDFDPQPTLRGNAIVLRPLTAADLDPLHAVASDPQVWIGHPAKDRYKRAVFEPYFAMLLASGTTLACCLADGGRVIGCSRYYTAPGEADSISIGYTFLGRDWWGGETNFAMKSLMLPHAFATVDTVWLHIDPSNIRSQKATAKLGAVLAQEGPLTLGGKQGIWQTWRLDQPAWQAVSTARQP